MGAEFATLDSQSLEGLSKHAAPRRGRTEGQTQTLKLPIGIASSSA